MESAKNKYTERYNINRGYKKLIVWQDSIKLYKLSCEILLNDKSFELKKIISNSLDAVHSICRNIAEGYSRRSIKEYLKFLNISLASCSEFHTCYYSFFVSGQITNIEFENLDTLHFKLENGLLALITSLQKKQKNGDWNDSFISGN